MNLVVKYRKHISETSQASQHVDEHANALDTR